MIKGLHYKSIRVKITLVFVVIFTVILLPANNLIYQKVRDTLMAADDREIISEANILLEETSYSPQRIPLPNAQRLISLRVTSENFSQELFTSPGFPLLDEFDYYLDILQVDTLKIAVVNRELDDLPGSSLQLLLARSNAPLETQLKDLRRYLIVGNVLSVAISGILALVLSQVVLNPVSRMAKTASKISASDSLERVAVPKSRDEVQMLGETINDMLKRIEEGINSQNNFFASAAHELRTPLAVMQTELSVALDKETDQNIRKVLSNQLSETQRLSRIIQDFLLVSQLKTKTLIIRQDLQPVDELIYRALSKTKYLSQERGVEIQLNLQEDIDDFNIYGDHDKLENVLINILENAYKYGKPHDKVCISLKSNADAFFTIGFDNKLVEPIEDIASLTSQYHKSKEYSSGLGLGLWICNEILRLHQGELRLSQKNLTFKAQVRLPKKTEAT
ncbi:MAG: HAMP domain-containing sensor histidine kinase [Bacteroidota bacterium]